MHPARDEKHHARPKTPPAAIEKGFVGTSFHPATEALTGGVSRARDAESLRGMIERMRRLARHVLAVFSALSLLLCVSFVVLAIRSYAFTHSVEYHPLYIADFRGSIYVAYCVWPYPRQLKFAGSENSDDFFLWHIAAPARRFWGFGWAKIDLGAGEAVHVVGIPLWFLAALAAVLPTHRLVRIVRGRNRCHRQRCIICGYDLRASPQRCPECGAVSNQRSV